MALSSVNGTVTLVDNTETNLFASQTLLKYYATKVFLHNMVAASVLTIRIYDNDPNSAVERLYDTQEFLGVQSNPQVFIPFLPSDSYRVTVQRGNAASLTITWARYDE